MTGNRLVCAATEHSRAIHVRPVQPTGPCIRNLSAVYLLTSCRHIVEE